jgi:hypothetical protein
MRRTALIDTTATDPNSSADIPESEAIVDGTITVVVYSITHFRTGVSRAGIAVDGAVVRAFPKSIVLTSTESQNARGATNANFVLDRDIVGHPIAIIVDPITNLDSRVATFNTALQRWVQR